MDVYAVRVCNKQKIYVTATFVGVRLCVRKVRVDVGMW